MFTQFQSWGIKAKIMTILFVSIFAISVAVEVVVIPLMEGYFMNERQIATQHVVEVVFGILQEHTKQVLLGQETSDEAKARAISLIKSLRYSGQEYFWIHDLSRPFPRMIMHPTVPSLDGKVLDDPLFNKATGKSTNSDRTMANMENRNLFVAMNEVVEAAGNGFVAYAWPKPKAGDGVTQELFPKISFVKKFHPWGWVIGSGVYLDDVKSAVSQVRHLIHAVSTILCLATILIYYLMVRYISRPVINLAQLAKRIADGEYGIQLPVKTNDEVGLLSESLNHMSKQVKEKTSDLEAANLELQKELCERRRLEEERINLERQLLHAQKLESLGIMAGGIAHDFNNLLAVIIGNLELSSMQLEKTSTAGTRIERAMQASLRAADLTKHMLEYSGRGVFEFKPLDINQLLKENCDLFRSILPKTITLKTEISTDLPLTFGDDEQLQQVIMNLITNAAEAIGDEPGSILIATGAQECDQDLLHQSKLENKLESGCYVYIDVTDTGCGMDEETRKRIFEPFYTTKFTGRGLGMSSVMGIIKAHNGAILLNSEPLTGSTFKILLPIIAGDHTAISSCIADKPHRDKAGTVLVVDDEELVREVCREYLKNMGLQILTAADGREAIDIFKQNMNDLSFVILDLTMPNMDGVVTLHELRQLQSDVKVIICSGHTTQTTAEAFINDKPDGFIQKPFQRQELQSVISKVFRGSSC